MSKGRRRLSEEEASLWDGVTRSIVPLRLTRKQRAALAREREDQVEAESKAPPRVKPAPPIKAPLPAKPKQPPAPAPLDRKLKQKLSRGNAPIEARLDLHGHTQGEAHAELLAFLRRAQARGMTMVLVITGKGMRGDGERGVLKRQVPLWLRLPEFSSYVVSFGDAAIAHGGEGALYVRLRKKKS